MCRICGFAQILNTTYIDLYLIVSGFEIMADDEKDGFKTIGIYLKTKDRMDAEKLCKDESYDSLINRLLNERKKIKKAA